MSFNYHPSKAQIERRSSPIMGRESWRCTECKFWFEGEKTLAFSMKKYNRPICFDCQKTNLKVNDNSKNDKLKGEE